MFVSFLMPHEFHGLDARHLLVFYKQLQDFGPSAIAFVGPRGYFRPPAQLLAEGRPEWQAGWRWMYEYEPPADLAGVRCRPLPPGLFDRRLSRLQSPLKLYRMLLTRRLPELEAAFAGALDDLGSIEPIEAILMFGNLPSIERVATERGIPVIHNEVGPLRKPGYAMTAYWDRSGVNGRTEAARRFEAYRREVASGSAPPLLSRRQILCTLARTPEALEDPPRDAAPPLGVALQTEDDSNVLAYGNGFGALDLVDLARHGRPREDVLVRHHPGQYLRLTDSLARIDDSPDAATFIRRCETVLTINSSVALEALLLGRHAVVLGDSPFRIASATGLGRRAPGGSRLQEALNFLAFGYLVPYPLIFDVEYHRWRLSSPTESAIAARHLAWYRERWPGPAQIADRALARDTAIALLAGGWPRDRARSLLVFGAGSGARQLIPILRESGLEVTAVFDSDPTRWGSSVLGTPVVAPTLVSGAIVVIASDTYADDIHDHLRRLGYGADRIVRVW